MQQHKAFTLLEVIIALAFSSFIILAITKFLKHASYLFNSSILSTEVDRRAYLILDRFEKDLSGATIEPISEVEKSKPETSKKESLSNDKNKEDKEPSKLFLASTQDTDEIKRKGKKRLQLFKGLNFITTSNMTIPGRVSIKPVRVLYSLLVDREKSRDGKTSYKLVRKETSDLNNFKFAKSSEFFDTKRATFNEFLIADNIKSFFVEYYIKKQEKDSKASSTQTRVIKSFTWGDKKDTKDILPAYVNIRLELWDLNKSKEYQYNSRAICFAYKYNPQEVIDAKKQQKNKEQPSKEGALSSTAEKEENTQALQLTIENSPAKE